MKYIITENRINNLLEKFILERYPMVRDVFFTTKLIRLAGEPNERGENDIIRNIININFMDGKMTHSPSYTGRQIRNDVNWGMEVKMVR
jgi:hypothetical protein